MIPLPPLPVLTGSKRPSANWPSGVWDHGTATMRKAGCGLLPTCRHSKNLSGRPLIKFVTTAEATAPCSGDWCRACQSSQAIPGLRSSGRCCAGTCNVSKRTQTRIRDLILRESEALFCRDSGELLNPSSGVNVSDKEFTAGKREKISVLRLTDDFFMIPLRSIVEIHGKNLFLLKLVSKDRP